MVKNAQKKNSDAKRRLDLYLVENHLCESREKAKAQIIAGEVRVDGSPVTAPAAIVHPEQVVTVDKPAPYVSRGGLKLEKAMKEFGLTLDGKLCADIGASTGGFTDCMLQNGARGVYAVDVGYGQLAWKLRNDPRVRVMERTNARYLDSLGEQVDFASVDVSFISLQLIFPAILRFLREGGEVVALIKPQFEAGKASVGKKGVVRDPEVHKEVIQNVLTGAQALGLGATDLTFSPIKGPNGNIEYLARFERGEGNVENERINEVVQLAHQGLDKKASGRTQD